MTINRILDALAIGGESTADLWGAIELMSKCAEMLCVEDETNNWPYSWITEDRFLIRSRACP